MFIVIKVESTQEFQQDKDGQAHQNIRNALFSEERFSNYPEKNKDRLAGIIATHTRNMAELLDLDPSIINLAVSSKEKVGEKNSKRPALHIEFDEKNKPTFSVLLPPHELEAYLKLMGNSLTAPFVEESVIWGLGHEIHHISQYENNKSSALKSADAALQEEWQYLGDEGEIAARMFAIAYAANRNIPLHNIHRQNTRLFMVLNALAFEGYCRLRNKAGR